MPNTVQLTVAVTVRARGRAAFGPAPPVYGWWSESGTAAAALLHRPPHPALVTSLPAGSTPALAGRPRRARA
ncbi:MAG: hypothetical protein ACLQI7_29555 [Streptosporangiaceae bacterium]